MHTKTFSAKIIHAINYLEFWTAKYSIITPRPQQKPTKTNSSLQKRTKQIQREHTNKENFGENLYPTFKIQRKTFSKVRIEIVVNLLAVMLNQKQRNQKGSPASLWP